MQCIVIGLVCGHVCNGRVVSKPYYSQHVRSVCVSLSAFFILLILHFFNGLIISFSAPLTPQPLCNVLLLTFMWVVCAGQTCFFVLFAAPCGLRGCKNGPAPFPGQMSYKATKPGLVFVLYLSMFFIVFVFIRAPFYVLLIFIIYVVCLLVVLVKLSLLPKLLARKTPLSSESSPLQFLALA